MRILNKFREDVRSLEKGGFLLTVTRAEKTCQSRFTKRFSAFYKNDMIFVEPTSLKLLEDLRISLLDDMRPSRLTRHYPPASAFY